jgi:hypothetical protein
MEELGAAEQTTPRNSQKKGYQKRPAVLSFELRLIVGLLI